MPIDQYELWHGAVLLKICRNDQPIALTLIESDGHRSAYRVNDTLLYIKHSAKPRPSRKGISWQFTFQPDHLRDLIGFMNDCETNMALVCGSQRLNDPMHIAFLTSDDIRRCLDLDAAINGQWIQVRYQRGCNLRVWGSNSGDTELRINQGALEDWIVPGR